MNNSIKYNTTNQPQIIITARKTANGWEFLLKDNGIGIPQNQQKTIFDMFTRVYS